MSHRRQPIGYTCPDIDKYINRIKAAVTKPRELKHLEPEDLFTAAETMYDQLIECIDYFEELRKSNTTLRNWGEEEAGNCDALEEENSELSDRLYALTH